MTPELSRPIAIARALDGTEVTVEATPAECGAVALRLGVPAVLALRCRFDLRAAGPAIILARGHLAARVVQTCVVSLEDFESDVAEDFQVRFVPAGTESDELDFDADDELPYENNTLELGEATFEQLALALDPFPRKPDAVTHSVAQAAGGPFAALAKLRKP